MEVMFSSNVVKTFNEIAFIYIRCVRILSLDVSHVIWNNFKSNELIRQTTKHSRSFHNHLYLLLHAPFAYYIESAPIFHILRRIS